MKAFITGGAGFIGSSLAKFLLNKNISVTVFDNFSSGKKENLEGLPNKSKLKIIKGDVLKFDSLVRAMKGHERVYHFSANADVRKGLVKTDLDLKQGTVATFNVLEAMRTLRIKNIIFPSSMTVYGKTGARLVSEDFGPSLPISLYGANKLASEVLISAFCHSFGMKSWILRFANVIGPNLTHGVIYDLVNKLKKDSSKLNVLGNGAQMKPYIYIDDLMEAIDYIIKNSDETINLFNVGVTTAISVSEIVGLILSRLNLTNTKVLYDKSPEGWVGDVTKCTLDISKMKKLGFTPRLSAREAVKKTLDSMSL